MPSLPRFPDSPPGGPVGLRPLAERDIPEILIAYQDDPELHRRLGRPRPPSGAELGRRCEQAEDDRLAGRGVWLTILQGGSDTCVGQVKLHELDWENARAELAIWVAPALRGRGLARGALRQVVGWLWERSGLQRVALHIALDNEAMIRSARAAGFAWEGVLRGYTLERGGRVDNAVLSILPADPRP